MSLSSRDGVEKLNESLLFGMVIGDEGFEP